MGQAGLEWERVREAKGGRLGEEGQGRWKAVTSYLGADGWVEGWGCGVVAVKRAGLGFAWCGFIRFDTRLGRCAYRMHVY